MPKRQLPIVFEQGLAALRIQRTRAAEALISKVGVGEVMCRVGCNHCCHYPVRISIFEGVLLYRDLQKTGAWTADLKKALEHHSKRTLDLASEIWLLANIPCPLLSEGRCIAYETRPFSCRATLSIQDPERCRPVHFNSSTFVDQRDESIAFEATLQKVARTIPTKILHRVAPISTAVLLGRRIVEGDGHVDGLDQEVMKEFASGTLH